MSKFGNFKSKTFLNKPTLKKTLFIVEKKSKDLTVALKNGCGIEVTEEQMEKPGLLIMMCALSKSLSNLRAEILKDVSRLLQPLTTQLEEIKTAVTQVEKWQTEIREL